MPEALAFAKGMEWLVVVVVLPFFWFVLDRYLTAQKEKLKKMSDMQERDERSLTDLQERIVKLEASYVTKSELVTLLQKLEDSIEMRFDRSFEKLERSMMNMFELRDKHDNKK